MNDDEFILKWRSQSTPISGGYYAGPGKVVAKQRNALRFRTRALARAAVSPSMMAGAGGYDVGWVVVRLVTR